MAPNVVGPMRPRLLLALLAASLIGSATADCPDGEYQCEAGAGCYDATAQACAPTFANETSCTAQGHTWASDKSCSCQCYKRVCDIGCYDQEDEACHPGLNDMQCAEIYGHVEWSPKCNCRLENQDYTPGPAAEAKEGQVNIYFSIPAFIVLFRESFEVVIVLVVIIQFLTKSRDNGMITNEQFTKFRREVYLGASLGFLCCLCMGIGFLVLASMAYKLFEGDTKLVFEGCMMIITCIVLTFLALNFYKMVHTMQGHERKMKKKVDEVLAASKEAETQSNVGFSRKHAFLTFSFMVGLREGLESILFLIGVVSDVEDLSSLPLPIITAIVLARVLGFFFFQGTKKVNVAWFMRISAFLLLFIAAGFFSSSMHNFQELGTFGTWRPRSARPWQNSKVFDARDCCNDKTNRVFVLIRALFGYQDQPTPVEFFAYALYWIGTAAIGTVLVHKAKKEMEKKLIEWQKMDEAEALEAKAQKIETPPEVIGDQREVAAIQL